MSRLDDFEDVVAQGSNEEKKRLVKEFVGKIEVDKEKRTADCYFYKVPPCIDQSPICTPVTGRYFDEEPGHKEIFELVSVEY